MSMSLEEHELVADENAKAWSAFNERIKFFFDSIRNLGISVGVLVAAKYAENIVIFPDPAPSPEFIGYFLIFISIIHFIVGTFVYFPLPKDFGINKKLWIIQLILLFYYFYILYMIYVFEIHSKL